MGIKNDRIFICFVAIDDVRFCYSSSFLFVDDAAVRAIVRSWRKLRRAPCPIFRACAHVGRDALPGHGAL